MSKKHILIIDDDDDFIYLTRRRLARQAWVASIDSVPDGRTALDYFRAILDRGAEGVASLPNVVLVDINMPGMSGFELLPALEVLFGDRGVSCPPPILLMATSSNLENDRRRAMACPLVTGFLTKPIDAADLASYVEPRAS